MHCLALAGVGLGPHVAAKGPGHAAVGIASQYDEMRRMDHEQLRARL